MTVCDLNRLRKARTCEDCAVECPNEATVRAIDDLGGPEFVYCDEHAPTRDIGVKLVPVKGES